MVREQAAIELGDLAQSVTERVTEGVSEAAGSAGERLRPVAEKAKDVGGKTAHKASEAYETTKSKVQEAQREQPITERVKEAASSVSERAHVDSENEGEHARQTCTQSSEDVLPATREHDIEYHKIPKETTAPRTRRRIEAEESSHSQRKA